MIELTKRTKIATGASRVVDWQQHGSGSGVFVDVDTSPAGFSKTPTYITAIHGMAHTGEPPVEMLSITLVQRDFGSISNT